MPGGGPQGYQGAMQQPGNCCRVWQAGRQATPGLVRADRVKQPLSGAETRARAWRRELVDDAHM